MKPFLQGKKEVAGCALRPPVRSLAPAPSASPAPAIPGHPAPTIDVVTEGEKVVRLVVTCACGEKVEVECLYRG